MKTQNVITSAVVAGFLTTAAFADNSIGTSVSAPAAVISQPATPNQIIYTPQLPSVAELTRAATAQKLTVKLIDQSAREVSITTQTSDGQTKVVSYQLLADATATAPAVVYAAPPSRDYYYDPYDPYYSAYWYPPVSVRLGFGFRGGRRW
jgi:hypothetical protein